MVAASLYPILVILGKTFGLNCPRLVWSRPSNFVLTTNVSTERADSHFPLVAATSVLCTEVLIN